ncbi:hypothetical protein [Niabella hibiscisoli]|uniref:hypothetical protein n=1 Tax=Niabella hibiscisoli TaxID=1825928 RepID=UPI001F0D565F|nr:hypothetical protein [Niabella hibiscisoli]MCH5719301.1 hypothetical protein [Niabella hibiscisoli]
MDKAVNEKGFELLDLCCQLVSEKSNSKQIGQWTNSDYQLLNGQIRRQTDISISPNTLKRIFGKLKTPERYYPQKATRDALAQYAGFKDWQSFADSHEVLSLSPRTMRKRKVNQVINILSLEMPTCLTPF